LETRKDPPEDQYSEAESQARFEKLVRSALNTKPKPLSEMTRGKRKAKRGASLRQRRKTASK
jgi:hypothetical protein